MSPGDPDWISLPNWKSEGPMAISKKVAEDIFNKRIVPDLFSDEAPPEEPTYVLVGGQQGSGKSTTVRQAEWSLKGATVRIIPDDFAKYNPRYHELAKTDPIRAADESWESSSKQFISAAKSLARSNLNNIIEECVQPYAAVQLLNYNARQGYIPEIRGLVTRRVESQTAIYSRASDALRKNDHIGTNALVSSELHDDCYGGWAAAFFEIERSHLAKRLMLTSRDGTVEYDNECISRNGRDEWTQKPRVLENLLRNRHKPTRDADAVAGAVDWQLIDLEKRFDRFPEVKDWNRAEIRDRILQFHSSDGARYDPYSKSENNSPAALAQWKDFVHDDLKLARKSSSEFGNSESFERALDAYQDALFELAESNVRIGAGSSRIEHARGARGVNDEVGASMDHAAAAQVLLSIGIGDVPTTGVTSQPSVAPTLPRLRPGNGAEFKGNKRARLQSGGDPPSKLRKLDKRHDRDGGAIGVA